MDDPRQALAYAGADFSAPHDAFVAAFRARFPAFDAGRVLDLGCGPGDVGLRFARALPGVCVLGVDGAAAMLELAQVAVRRAGLEARVCFERRHLPDATIAGPFDAVISNSLLHHLAEPHTLWQTVAATARPGAPFLVMDLARPDSASAAEALCERYAADAPEVLRRDFHHSLLAAYTPDEVRAQLAGAAFRQARVEAVGDRHWLAWGYA